MAIHGDPPYGYGFNSPLPNPYHIGDWPYPYAGGDWDRSRTLGGRPIWPIYEPEPEPKPKPKTNPKSLPLMASQKVKRFRRVPNARRLFLQSQGLDF